MKQKTSFKVIVFTLCILLFAFTVLLSPAYAGITDTVKSIHDTIKGINETINGISNFIKALYTITSAIGFKTILFLTAVMLFSSGLASLGIPRGLASLIISLTMVNSIWILWNKSMASTPVISSQMLYSNGFIALPLVALYLLKILIRVIKDRSPAAKININGKPDEILKSLTLLTGRAQEALIRNNNSKLSVESKKALLNLKNFLNTKKNIENHEIDN